MPFGMQSRYVVQAILIALLGAVAIGALILLPATVYGFIAATATAVLAAAAMVGLRRSRRTQRSIDALRKAVNRFASGEFNPIEPLPASPEFADLARALDRMASRLDERVRREVEERNERDAIVESMAEGVVAVDREQRIISINSAASALLGVDVASVQGLPLLEVVRNADLESLARNAFESDGPIQREIRLHQDERREVDVKGAVLRDTQGRSMGVVLVLNDVTRLRKLERVRRDFVSNVSHELRTPLTTIKGFVETLQQSAMDSPEDAKRFLGLVAKHVNRLQAIIEDLTSLSRIEQGSNTDELAFCNCDLREIIDNAVQICQSAAARNEIRVLVECGGGLVLRANAALMEQCLVNLLDNAIKYSPAGRDVTIAARLDGNDVSIAVSDEGIGISKEHQERIFERFYRVDKGRSRAAGGTGLGLSIVRHIIQLHNGQIDVESRTGAGTTFRVRIPSAPQPAPLSTTTAG